MWKNKKDFLIKIIIISKKKKKIKIKLIQINNYIKNFFSKILDIEKN